MPLEVEEIEELWRQKRSTQNLTVETDMLSVLRHRDHVVRLIMFGVGGAFVGLAVGGVLAQFAFGVETTMDMEILFAIIGAVLGSVSARF